jgi:MFS family permease
MMPASMALIRQAFPEAKARGRAVGVWAMGGAVASSSGPVLGGVLNLIDWRPAALAVAVFGGLLADPGTFVRGVHTSLLLAAAGLALTTALALFLPTTKEHS